MKPTTCQIISHERLSCANPSDTKTATIPNGTSAVLLAVETNPVRMTCTTTGDPTTTTGLILQKDQMPWLLLIGQGATLKFAPPTGTAVIQLAYLQ